MEFNTFYQELQYSTEMIRALLAGVAPEAARLKPNAESWSILEVVCHIYDEEREDFREHLDFILHRQSEEWHAVDTEGWVTQRKYNEQNFVEMQEKFFVEREKSFAWLKGLVNPDWEKTYTTEYRTISAGEMFACWVAHGNCMLSACLYKLNLFSPFQVALTGVVGQDVICRRNGNADQC